MRGDIEADMDTILDLIEDAIQAAQDGDDFRSPRDKAEAAIRALARTASDAMDEADELEPYKDEVEQAKDEVEQAEALRDALWSVRHSPDVAPIIDAFDIGPLITMSVR